MSERPAQDPSPLEPLRTIEERLQFFLDHAPGRLAMFDREMRYLAVNRRWQEDYAPPGMVVIGKCHYDVYPGQTELWKDAHRRGLAGEVVRVEQERLPVPDGSAVWLRWQVEPWYDTAGAVGGIVLSVEDITAYVASEEAARAARRDFANLIATVDGIVWEADARTFAFTFVSAQAERILGYPVRAWIDDPTFWSTHIHPDDRDESVRYCVECTNAARDHQFDYRMIAADGRIVWLQDRVTVHVVDGRAMTLRGVMVDITERKLAEAALRNSEERFRTLADTAPMMVWATNANGQPDFINQRWIAFFGSELHEVPPDGWYEFLHPDDRQRWAAVQRHAFETLQPFEIDSRSRRADGEYRWVSTHGVPRFDASGTFAGYIGTAIDITDRRRAEETRQRLEAQLRQSQKMEAMGTLAGGIAHDFNNILAAIGGNLELVGMDLEGEHRAQQSLNEVRRAVRRAGELVQRILTFSRPETHEHEATQLAPVVVEAVRLLRSLIPAGVDLSHTIAPDLPDVVANPSQVHQVIVNLTTNAWQAMDGGSGRVAIGLDTLAVDRSTAEAHPDLQPGTYVCLSVSDTGHGIDAALLERIFEPFFTTKGPGKGTGLGLSMVHGIARGHGGAVLVDSEPKRGSTFKVLFPTGVSGTAHDSADLSHVPETLRGHGERILYVDDEEALVSVSVRFLERLGYAVAGFTSAEDALAAFRARPDAFDLVVTDYNMPNMSGMDVALAVMGDRPALPVALASGFMRPAEIEHARALGIRATIPKPHSLEELGTIVQRLLHARHEQP